MPIPNTITRSLELPHPQEKVWAAIATAEGLAGWFGNHAEGEVIPGGHVRLRWDDYDVDGTLEIQVVDPMSTMAYCWAISGAPVDDPRRTYVEFRLQPTGAGTTLTVTESGFAQLPDEWLESAYSGNIEGWRSELDELVAYLDAA